jgi:hypothetical protein
MRTDLFTSSEFSGLTWANARVRFPLQRGIRCHPRARLSAGTYWLLRQLRDLPAKGPDAILAQEPQAAPEPLKKSPRRCSTRRAGRSAGSSMRATIASWRLSETPSRGCEPVSPRSSFRLVASRRPRLGSLDRAQSLPTARSPSLSCPPDRGDGRGLPLRAAKKVSDAQPCLDRLDSRLLRILSTEKSRPGPASDGRRERTDARPTLCPRLSAGTYRRSTYWLAGRHLTLKC